MNLLVINFVRYRRVQSIVNFLWRLNAVFFCKKLFSKANKLFGAYFGVTDEITIFDFYNLDDAELCCSY